MIFLSGPYRIGAVFTLISGFLHIFAVLVGGASFDALMLVPIGVLYLGVAYGLARGFRGLAYLAFLGLIIGGIVALTNVWVMSAVPSWWYVLIITADWTAAMGLFVALWRKAPQASVT